MLSPSRSLTQREIDKLIQDLLNTQEKEKPGQLTRAS